MKPAEITSAVAKLELGRLRDLADVNDDKLTAKRSNEIRAINGYVAELEERYRDEKGPIAELLYAQAVTIFCREAWDVGLVQTEAIKVGIHHEEGIGDLDVRARMILRTDFAEPAGFGFKKPNQIFDILIGLGTSGSPLLDAQRLVWNKDSFTASPDFLDWAKLMLEKADTPDNAPRMYESSTILRVDESNADGLRQVWVPAVSPLEDPRHMLEFLRQQALAA